MPIKIHNVKKDIEVDVEARFHTNNYSKEDNRPLPIGWNKKLIGLMKDELSGRIITEFVVLRATSIRCLQIFMLNCTISQNQRINE